MSLWPVFGVLIGICISFGTTLSKLNERLDKIDESLKYQEYMLIPEEFFFPENRELLKDVKTIDEFLKFNRAVQDTAFTLFIEEDVSPTNY